MKSRGVYFRNLDSIRFIAAMMVFFGHAIKGAFDQLNIDGTILRGILDVVSNGAMGVSIFFVLSGFLITYLIITEIEDEGRLNIRNFYIRRFLRIWPLYYAVVIFSFLIYPGLKILLGVNNPLSSNIIYHLFFLSNFDAFNVIHFHNGQDAMSQNITWSVSVEEQFYLFWPLIFLLPKKYWLYVFSSLFVFSTLFRIQHTEIPHLNYFHTFSVVIDLVIGGLFAYGVKTKQWIRQVFESTGTLSHSLLFLVTFLVLYFGTDHLLGYYSESIGRLVTSTLFAFIIASQSMTRNRSLLNLGNFGFANRWGKYTYGIYLIHPIAITLIDILCRISHVDPKSSFWAQLSAGLAMLGLTLVMSKLSYNYFEKPFLALKRKFQIVKSHMDVST